jgi:hypothetical protein
MHWRVHCHPSRMRVRLRSSQSLRAGGGQRVRVRKGALDSCRVCLRVSSASECG